MALRARQPPEIKYIEVIDDIVYFVDTHHRYVARMRLQEWDSVMWERLTRGNV